MLDARGRALGVSGYETVRCSSRGEESVVEVMLVGGLESDVLRRDLGVVTDSGTEMK